MAVEEEVEEAIRAATADGNFTPFNALVDRLSEPCAADPEADPEHASPPRPEQEVTATFCGT